MGRITVDPGKVFGKTKDFLIHAQKQFPDIRTLQTYGQLGVDNLKYFTPKRTGKTSESWKYEIVKEKDGIAIYWINTNITYSDGTYYSVAVLIQNGYVSKYGNWIAPRDYLTPALEPVIEALNKALDKEVKDL